MHDTALIVFARAPVPGQAKTRLIPVLGADGAAHLAARMLGHTLAAASTCGLGPVELHGAPDASDATLQAAAVDAGATLRAQGDGDLGVRMSSALERALRSAPRALLMGTDCPALDASVLRNADAALEDGNDIVLLPVDDGGFALIGVARNASPSLPALLDGLAWSTDTVMVALRSRLKAAGMRWAELPKLADVDLPADLVHVPRDWLPARDPPACGGAGNRDVARAPA